MVTINREKVSKNLPSTSKNKLEKILLKINPFQGKTKIQTQLLTTLLPTVLTPLLVASTISYSIISQRLQSDLEKKVSNQVILARQAVNDAFIKSVSIPQILSITPSIVNLAQNASEVVKEEGLPLVSQLDSASTATIEEKYQQEKLLKTNESKDINEFLTLIQEREAIRKIIITDKNGYTLAYSDTPSRFIHHQEKWWQEGKNRNSWASPVRLENEERIIDYAQKISDSQTGDLLGVMKFQIPLSRFDVLSVYLENSGGMAETQLIEIIDTESKKIITSASLDSGLDTPSLLENEVIFGVIESIQQQDANAEEVLFDEIINSILEKFPVKNLEIYKGFDSNFFSDDLLSGYTLNASFIFEGKKILYGYYTGNFMDCDRIYRYSRNCIGRKRINLGIFNRSRSFRNRHHWNYYFYFSKNILPPHQLSKKSPRSSRR